MKNYRPLLFEGIDLRLPGLRATRLRLNRHTPEARPEPHSHDHAQVLIYLSGSGVQTIDGSLEFARPGTVFYVAPGKVHAFERQKARRPLCLVVDLELDLRRADGKLRSRGEIGTGELTRIRGRLSELFSMRGEDPEVMQLKLGAAILDILDPTLGAIGWLKGKARQGQRTTVTRRAEKVLAVENGERSLAELAEQIGYQQDYLNRLLKSESGLTLGQLRAKLRLEKAQRLLRDPALAVGDIAEQIGILDNNYFARWFRAQTGLSPSAWRSKSVKRTAAS